MVLALFIAVLAVALGLALGLAPVVGRHAIGPLRTLALSAVIGVVVVHLLPEAFSTLGLLGLVVFVLSLAIPRLAARLRSASGRPVRSHVGLELGFWGLLVHHVGDGLALGAYARLDERTGHSHLDVFLALVLHTVPLVAVVSAGYARMRGTSRALQRGVLLAAASVVGIFTAGLLPGEWVERAQAWIAAGVAGLLLHGMSHEMLEDLPKTRAGRSLDLCAALAGGTIGWVGVYLDAHHHHGVASVQALGQSLLRVALSAAFPLCLGLLLGAAVGLLPARLRAFRAFEGSEPRRGLLLGPESLLLTLIYFGWAFALAAYALVLAFVMGEPKPERANGSANKGAAPLFWLGTRLAERLDHVGAWAFAGIVTAALLVTAIPEGALFGLGEALSVPLSLLLVLALPLHAVFAPLLSAALSTKGLSIAAALFICAFGPASVRALRARKWWFGVVALGAALLVGTRLPIRSLMIDERVSWSALLILGALFMVRIYGLGLRGFLAPLAPCDARIASHSAHVDGERERGDHVFSRE